MLTETLPLSVVIPTLNERDGLPALLGDLAGLQVGHEIIVADGGSTDGTAEAATAAGARAIVGPPGRGEQLRAGAREARGRLLFFVHADCRLPPAAVDRLTALALDLPAHAVAFRLRIDSTRRIYRMLERGTELRGRLLGLPYGDQGLAVRADAYEAAGGFPPIPLMEDVALVRALKNGSGVRLAREEILVSPRRWETDGPLRRTAKNLLLLSRYLIGADPRRLARAYRANG